MALINLLFPKLSEHRRMNERYFRTRKTNEAIWVSQFLDLLNDFFKGQNYAIILEYLHVCIRAKWKSRGTSRPLHSVCAALVPFVGSEN